jgi:RNA polymerase sigma factor (sigma-70 family)
MGKGRLDRALGRFAALLNEHVRADGELLELFVQKKDETAFAALVRRQGPMVLGVCRRVLGNEHDAEDAFQATFLVLARKAASVRPRGRVANWLYGVAYRTALEARRAAARRRAREAKAMPRQEGTDDAVNDLRQILDEELARLPDRYREVVVLCELQGHGRKEVARELGCPEGTVASRLSRARNLLAARLTRRGLTHSTAGVAAALDPQGASACVPPSLASTTVKAAKLLVAGQVTAGVTTAQVTFLTERVVRTMLLMKLKALTALVLLVGMIAGGAGWAYHQRATANQPDSQANKTSSVGAPAKGDEDKSPETVEGLKREIRELQDRVAALEAELKAKPKTRQEVLYQGKPASFWIRQLQDRDGNFRTKAVVALGCIGEVDRSVIPLVVETMKDREMNTRTWAVSAARRIGKEAVPSIVAAIKASSSYDEKQHLLEAIKSIGQNAKDAVSVLIPLLKAADTSERLDATQALGAIGPAASSAVPALLDLLQNTKNPDRIIVVQALGQIGPGAKAAVPALISILNEQNPPHVVMRDEIRPVVAAAKALGDIGPDANAALPLLRQILKKEEARSTKEGKARPPAPVRLGPGGVPALTFEQTLRQAIRHIDPNSVPPE